MFQIVHCNFYSGKKRQKGKEKSQQFGSTVEKNAAAYSSYEVFFESMEGGRYREKHLSDKMDSKNKKNGGTLDLLNTVSNYLANIKKFVYHILFSFLFFKAPK